MKKLIIIGLLILSSLVSAQDVFEFGFKVDAFDLEKKKLRQELVKDIMIQAYDNIISSPAKLVTYKNYHAFNENQMFHLLNQEAHGAMIEYLNKNERGLYKVAKLAGINDVYEGHSKPHTTKTNLHKHDKILLEFIDNEPVEMEVARRMLARDVQMSLSEQLHKFTKVWINFDNAKAGIFFDELHGSKKLWDMAKKKGLTNELSDFLQHLDNGVDHTSLSKAQLMNFKTNGGAAGHKLEVAFLNYYWDRSKLTYVSGERTYDNIVKMSGRLADDYSKSMLTSEQWLKKVILGVMR